MRASSASTSFTAWAIDAGVASPPECTPNPAQRIMCVKAPGSISVPLAESPVGPTWMRVNPTSGCSARQVSTMRLSAALVEVYTPIPGQIAPRLETDDR